MKIFLLICLSLFLNSAAASLEMSSYSDEQICMFAKDPPVPDQIIFELVDREIECDDGMVINTPETLILKDSARLLRFKRWNKMLRGKGPIYSTHSGTNLKIDTLGNEKSIIIDKAF